MERTYDKQQILDIFLKALEESTLVLSIVQKIDKRGMFQVIYSP